MRRSPWRTFGRILLRVVAACAVLLAIAGLAGLVIVQSGWFHEYVRARIIAELERATGGRVEIGRFSFRGPTLTASVAPLVIHGSEAAGEPPLVRAASVTVGLRVLSFAERKVDVASVKVDQPQVRIVIYPDGSNNLPGRGSGNWPVDMINLAVGHYEVSGGVIELDERSTPVNLRGDGLELKLTYDPRTPAYQAEVGSRELRVIAAGMPPQELGFSSKFSFQKTRIVVTALHLSTPQSHADLAGTLDNPMSPRGTLKVRAAISLKDAVSRFSLPLEPVGTADFAGTLAIDFDQLSEFEIKGRLSARGVGYSSGRLHVSGAGVQAEVDAGARRVEANHLQVDALGSHFAGQLVLTGWKEVHVEGSVDGLTVAEAASIVTPRALPWNGTLSGDVMADCTIGERTTLARASLTLAPAAAGTPIEGSIEASYNQQAGELSFGDSYIATPSSRLEASGALGRRMEVRLKTSDLGDLLSVLPLLEEDAPKELPLQLNNGSVTASGAVTGSLENPRFRGEVTVVNASVEGHGSVEGHSFDKFDATVDLTRDSLSASRFTLTRGVTEAAGTADITAAQGSFDDAGVTAQLTLRNANLGELAKEAGAKIVVEGTASAGVRVSGTLKQPQADVTLNVANEQAFGETLDRIAATLKLTRMGVEVSGGQADAGPGRMNFSGSYRASAADWSSGDAQAQVTIRNLPATRVKTLAELNTGLEGRVTADLRGDGQVSSGTFALRAASGTLSAQTVTLHGQALGEFSLSADTRGEEASVKATGKLGAAMLEGQGSWRLSGEENGSASVKFSRMTLDEAHRLAMLLGAAPQSETELPLEGALAGGTVAVNVAVTRPRDFQASVTLDGVQFNPKAGQALGLGVQPQDVVLTSAQPIMVSVNAREARIQPARLTGRDTNLEISGTIPFEGSGGADLAVRGAVNLVALQLLNANLLARGNATVSATLRGALADPALSGRMDLKNASLYLKDVTTGLDNVNGGVVFNRNRATIDKLTAQIGAGTLSLGGFVEFGSPLIYRLQAAAQQVRFRLPIDLSTTISANLALDGTSDASTLSGTLTLNRAAFNPHTDLGDLLAAFSAPQPENSPNDYLRGMQFDVRVASAPNFELQTSLTRDVQSEVDLRLRGTPRLPLLLGSVSVDSGQVQVFGNQYTIDRGDIRFTNAARIEPVFDLALETKVSGVTVNITFTGTMDKLKTNYSSDPPLEPSKIIALLAVGRTPSQLADSGAEAAGNSTNFVGAGGSLLSQALSEQLSSKLQRFLGASRVKIDPTMTGIDNTPQARLTFEQQVSKDVTMTYITNLNYTAEQIVRLQWDFNRNWSAIAVRDANGLFGIDFQYRRRFK